MKFLAPEPIPSVIKALYAEQRKLMEAFSDYGFSLDGNLIGDVGEVIAKIVFGLEKLPGNHPGHDMKLPDSSILVQVKTTQQGPAWKSVGLGVKKREFQFLLVIQLEQDGTFEVLYNGPGCVIDDKRSHKKSASLSRKQLRECQQEILEDQRLKPDPDWAETDSK